MTATGPRTDSPEPAPGGTAKLAGRSVARIGFGAMQLARAGVARDAALAILRQAAGAGVNHIDAAHFYGSTNELIRDALAPYPPDLVIVTKVGAARNAAGGLVPGQRPHELREQVEDNLAALGAEQVGVVNLRRLDAQPGLIAEGDQQVGLDDQLAELCALRNAGKIGGIGLSNVSAGQLRQALPAGIACVQNSYGVLNRSAEPVLELCREHDIAWVPFFPIRSAVPGGPKATADPTVAAIAAAAGATPVQVVLAWLLAHHDGTLLIPGTADPAHLAENIAAGSLSLRAESVAALDRLAAPAAGCLA
ncbi:MAG TPA: aldo/keto reductase [Streptosporangiaceae bacterium]|nr:aldo/keto reductase [Streptosporangiaceae bacterium]